MAKVRDKWRDNFLILFFLFLSIILFFLIKSISTLERDLFWLYLSPLEFFQTSHTLFIATHLPFPASESLSGASRERKREIPSSTSSHGSSGFSLTARFSFSLRDRLSSFAAVSQFRCPVINTNVKWFPRDGAKFPGNIVRAGGFALENLLSETSVPFSAIRLDLLWSISSHLVSLLSPLSFSFFLSISTITLTPYQSIRLIRRSIINRAWDLSGKSSRGFDRPSSRVLTANEVVTSSARWIERAKSPPSDRINGDDESAMGGGKIGRTVPDEQTKWTEGSFGQELRSKRRNLFA